MKPLAELDARGVKALLFDIDDTVTTEGKLTAQAYDALERLQRAGKIMVPVTGGPAGWCDHIARMWPVDAVVGENGAFYFFSAGGRLQKRFQGRCRDAARETCSPGRHRAPHPRRRSGLRPRCGPELPRDRPRHRLLR